MNKTAAPNPYRLFLIEKLPDPLIPASAHIQIFDNYIEATRLRLRLIREPASRNWTRILQQQILTDESNVGSVKLAEIYLNETEYSFFEQFEGNEIRKNRYFHEFDRVNFRFDVFLGDLWGLTMASVSFEDAREADRFEPPPFAIIEITNSAFFTGANLVGKKFEDVQEEVSQIAATGAPLIELQDE